MLHIILVKCIKLTYKNIPPVHFFTIKYYRREFSAEIEQLTIYEGPVSIDPLPMNDSTCIVYSRLYRYEYRLFFVFSLFIIGIVLF